MDYKKEAITKLREYQSRKNSLLTIPKEIERLEVEFEGFRCAIQTGGVYSRGSAADDRLVSNIAHREELVRTMRQAQLWVETVERALSQLTDEEHLILDTLYIEPRRNAMDILCEELCVEKTVAYEKRNAALRRFTISFYGATES